MPAGVRGAPVFDAPVFQSPARRRIPWARRVASVSTRFFRVVSRAAPEKTMKDLSPPRVLPAVVTEPTSRSPKGLTCVLIHGWPDSPLMWSSQVTALTNAGHRCIAVPLPCYHPDDAAANLPGVTLPTFDTAVDDVIVTIESLTNEDDEPVVLVCHDWGCIVGYRLQGKRPRLVRAVCAMDVGNDVDGLTAKEMAFIAAYQGWLIAALAIGGNVGDWMTTSFARMSNAPSLQPGGLDFGRGGIVPHRRNWPYLAFWRERLGRRARGGGDDRNGNRVIRGVTGNRRVPHCPVLYMYGADKPSRFHGDGWLAGVRANGVGSLVVRVENAGHWFPVTHADVVNERLTRWLDLIGDLPRTNIRSAL